jgi:hypothetical protein
MTKRAWLADLDRILTSEATSGYEAACALRLIRDGLKELTQDAEPKSRGEAYYMDIEDGLIPLSEHYRREHARKYGLPDVPFAFWLGAEGHE